MRERVAAHGGSLQADPHADGAFGDSTHIPYRTRTPGHGGQP
ncbi:hypothetical protein ACIA8K_29570 [Catenuloplanes sp. NPDC051500]